MPIEKAELELRATFPQSGKYGLGEDTGSAMERLVYVLDLASSAPPARVRELVARARASCHAENSLTTVVPVEPAVRLNGQDL